MFASFLFQVYANIAGLLTSLCTTSLVPQMLEVTKDAWPECVNLRMTALDCKAFIDNEIYSLFTERDKYVRSIIIGKRTKEDQWYNAVVIQMGDDDMVQGRDGDGMIYYDL